MPPHQSAAELNSRLKKAREDHAKLKELKKQEDNKKGLLRNAQDTIREMEQKISMMCKKDGCTLYAELEEKEDLSGRKRIMEEKIEQCEKDLQRIAHNGGMTEEELIREAERYNPDDLPLWIEGLNQQIAEKDEELSKIAQIIWSEAKEHEKMDGAPAQPRHQKR